MTRSWARRRTVKQERLAAVAEYADGKLIDPSRLREVFEAALRPGDKVALEGDNQKQADFLSRTLAQCAPAKVYDLHMLISSVGRTEHLDLFEKKIATKLDLAYAGPQSVRIAQMVSDETVQIGAIHTYVELYARMLVDLIPNALRHRSLPDIRPEHLPPRSPRACPHFPKHSTRRGYGANRCTRSAQMDSGVWRPSKGCSYMLCATSLRQAEINSGLPTSIQQARWFLGGRRPR